MKKPPRKPQARPRGPDGRFLNRRQIAARRGVQTRLRAARTRAAQEGARKRRATDQRRTPAQKRRITIQAERIERSERARRGWETRRKKAARVTAPPPSSARLRNLRPTREPGSESRSRPVRKSSASQRRHVNAPAIRTAPGSGIETIDVGGSGDPLKVQVRVDLDLPAGMKNDPAQRSHIRKLADAAILHRIETGQDAPFTRTEILQWKNPGRLHAEDRKWRRGNQDDAWVSLGPPLREALMLRL